MSGSALHSAPASPPSSYSSWQKHSHDPLSEECDLRAMCLVPLLPGEAVGGKNNTRMDGWMDSVWVLQKAKHLLAVQTLVLWGVKGWERKVSCPLPIPEQKAEQTPPPLS